jgi:hypothetical protein
MLLVTTELALWRYDNAFLFTSQSKVDFGIALVFSSVTCLALPYFFTFSYKRHDFQEKYLLNIKYVLCFSLQFSYATFLIPRIQRDVIIKVHWSSCKVLVTLVTW